MQTNDPLYGFSFIDMSFRQPMNGTINNAPVSGTRAASVLEDGEALSKLKRTACVLCRKRKLKCDGGRPKCQTCNRLGHDCTYDEMRKKSGPKRGYVKALEARLAQVETQLASSAHDMPDTAYHPNDIDMATTGTFETGPPVRGSIGLPDAQSFHGRNGSCASLESHDFQTTTDPYGRKGSCMTQEPQVFQTMPDTVPLYNQDDLTASLNAMSQFQEPSMTYDETVSWDLISLGLQEPLPTTEVATELTEIFFNRIYPAIPIINRARFYSNMHLAPTSRPPVCLRYAMWTHAAALDDRYTAMTDHFYRRARKYLQVDEMKGFGEGMISLYHCQAWVLVSTYEFKNMHFPRAWMSTGRATRLAHMLGLHRLDGQGLDVKQCLQPATEWVEKEERRRTFWMAFAGDRYASIGTGWPMGIDEQDIMTRLPASEEAFQNGKQEHTLTLKEAFDGRSGATSSFALCSLLAALFGRNLIHLHRPTAEDCEHDLDGMFWERHRKLDSILVNIIMTLPQHQRIPFGLPEPNVVFLNMCIHTSVICLHQAAIFKADKFRMPPHVSSESRMRCLTAAGEIANNMRAITHLDLAVLNPFMVFCLYVGARVFIQYLKAKRNDQRILASLDFLLRAMHVMKRKNGLTGSFIAQLDLDMEIAGIPNPNFHGTLDELLKKGAPVFPRKGPSSGMMHPARVDFDQRQSGFRTMSNNNTPRPPPGTIPNVLDPKMNRFPNVSTSTSPERQEMNLPYMKQRQPKPAEGIPSTWNEAVRPTSNGRMETTYPACLNDGPSPHTMSDTTDPVHRSPPISTKIDSLPRHNSYPSVPTPSWTNPPGLTTGESPASSNLFSKSASHSNTTSATTPCSTVHHGTTPPVVIESDFNTLTNQFFPVTPGVDLSKLPEGWDWPGGPGGTGMTPGNPGSEDWEKILGDMGGWGPMSNNSVRQAEPWSVGRAAY